MSAENNQEVKMFHCDGCDCDIVRDSREHDECLCDKNGENWVCGDCYQGEYDKECAHCGELCPDEYEGDIDGDEKPLCEDCFEQMEKCEMCGDATDAEPWKDVEGEVLHCSDCKDKRMREIAEAIAQIMPISAKAEGIAEEIEIIKQMKAEVEAEPKPFQMPFQMFQSIIAEAVAKQEAEPEPDEEFEAEVSNSHLLEVFGGEVVYNKLKALAKHPDLSSTLRVVWKFGKEHLSLYVYIEGEPFLDAVYPRNHSCDMFYMLEELKKEQECDNEVAGVCWECGVEGKFIGKEGDDWRCLDCSSM